MAWDLRGNMGEEIARSMLLDDFTPDEVALFYPDYPEEHPVIVGNSAARTAGPGLVDLDCKLVGPDLESTRCDGCAPEHIFLVT